MKKMVELEKDNDISVPILVHTDLRVVDSNLNEIAPSFCKYSNLNGNRLAVNQLLVQNVVTGECSRRSGLRARQRHTGGFPCRCLPKW